MLKAVDSSALLDVVTDSRSYADASEKALDLFLIAEDYRLIRDSGRSGTVLPPAGVADFSVDRDFQVQRTVES